ncbi:heavy-metal-associated domain-containing protein [Nocardia sp. NBC_00511]|uniref:heavy-metal-associated domain-containing protein n=1 Tax=Nocardia sp. NBC_00511 TaxID=2903591 RepID=UPI0030E4A45F
MSEIVYTVQGMTCGHCAGAVTKALTAIDGIDTVEVNVEAGQVTVTGAAADSVDLIRAAVDDAGYELAQA